MSVMKWGWKSKSNIHNCKVLGKNTYEKWYLEIGQLKIICAPYTLDNVHGNAYASTKTTVLKDRVSSKEKERKINIFLECEFKNVSTAGRVIYNSFHIVEDCLSTRV